MSEKGAEVLQRMLGPERTAEVRTGWSKLSPDFDDLVTNFLAEEIWSRPGLEPKLRSLVTIAAATALGRTSALRLHIEMGLNNGLTEAQIREAFIHLAFYAGFPAAWDALVIANEVFGREKNGDPKKVTVLRPDDTSLYITQDIATSILKIQEHDLNFSIYVVGSEQEYHFKCLFQILAALGYAWAQDCYHLSYGMVLLIHFLKALFQV